METHRCRCCGLLLSSGDICSVCSVAEYGGMVKVWKSNCWISSIFATTESCEEMPEPDAILPAVDFAEFVLEERRMRGLI